MSTWVVSVFQCNTNGSYPMIQELSKIVEPTEDDTKQKKYRDRSTTEIMLTFPVT